MTLLRYLWLPVNCALHLWHRQPSKTVAQTRINKQANAQNATSLSVMCNYGDIYHFATGGGNNFKFGSHLYSQTVWSATFELALLKQRRIKCQPRLLFFFLRTFTNTFFVPLFFFCTFILQVPNLFNLAKAFIFILSTLAMRNKSILNFWSLTVFRKKLEEKKIKSRTLSFQLTADNCLTSIWSCRAFFFLFASWC